MRKRLTVFLGALMGGALIAAPAFAGSVTTTLSVTATVPGSCGVSTSPVAFGSYSGTQVDANGSVTVNCSLDLPYSVELDGGAGGGASRQMLKVGDATKALVYELYQDPPRSQVWGGSAYSVSGAAALTGQMGTGADQTVSVYGRIPGGGSSSPGDFTDSVSVTVLY
jgi:spore coat protein U-like protein